MNDIHYIKNIKIVLIIGTIIGIWGYSLVIITKNPYFNILGLIGNIIQLSAFLAIKYRKEI